MKRGGAEVILRIDVGSGFDQAQVNIPLITTGGVGDHKGRGSRCGVAIVGTGTGGQGLRHQVRAAAADGFIHKFVGGDGQRGRGRKQRENEQNELEHGDFPLKEELG